MIEVAENDEESQASENLTDVGDERLSKPSVMEASNLESNRLNWAS